jgi:hypothetical protein
LSVGLFIHRSGVFRQDLKESQTKLLLDKVR